MGGIRQTEGADVAGAPGLSEYPLQGIKPVGSLAQILGERAFGTVATAQVLHDNGVTALDKIGGDFGALTRSRVGVGAFAVARARLVVGGALDENGKGARNGDTVPGWSVYVGGEADAVPHGDHNVAIDDDVKVSNWFGIHCPYPLPYLAIDVYMAPVRSLRFAV